MPQLIINLEGDGILEGFPPEKVINIETPVVVSTLPRGMISGLPSVAIIADLPDGQKAFIQTSARLFIQAAEIIKARYHRELGLGGHSGYVPSASSFNPPEGDSNG